MNSVGDIVCQPDSWQFSQLSTDERTSLNGGTESSLVCSLLPRLQHRSFNPMAYHLAKIDWSVFGTGTFEHDWLTFNTAKAEDFRQIEFFSLIGCLCAKHRLRARNLVFYGKTEWGENRRGHFNFLIGRRGTEKISPEILAASMQELWTSGERRRGIAKIEPFRQDWHLEGILYQSKYEHDAYGEQLPICEVLSPMLEKVIRRNAIPSENRAALSQRPVETRGFAIV
jgi:hypothetical protein